MIIKLIVCVVHTSLHLFFEQIVCCSLYGHCILHCVLAHCSVCFIVNFFHLLIVTHWKFIPIQRKPKPLLLREEVLSLRGSLRCSHEKIFSKSLRSINKGSLLIRRKDIIVRWRISNSLSKIEVRTLIKLVLLARA